MYSQQDVNLISRQLRLRVLVWLVPEALLAAGVVISFIARTEWLTSLLFALLCAVMFFSLSIHILPVWRYREHIKHALFGKTTSNVSRFDSFSQVPVTVDGVRFYPLMMKVDGPKEAFNQRQFYWDANLPQPELEQGRKYRLISHEKAVVAWEPAPDDAQTNA